MRKDKKKGVLFSDYKSEREMFMNKRSFKRGIKILTVIVLVAAVAFVLYEPLMPVRKAADTTTTTADVVENSTASQTQTVENSGINVSWMAATETGTEQVTEPMTEPMTEPVTEPVTEPMTDSVSVGVTEAEDVIAAYTPTLTLIGTEPVATVPVENSPTIVPSALERQAFEMLNNFRKENGAEPLAFESVCLEAARTRACEATNVWSHTRPDGRSFISIIEDMDCIGRYCHVGENLAKDAPSLEVAMRSLELSEGHKANMLAQDYDAVAIGIYNMGNGRFAMCQLFVQYAESERGK